MKNKKIIILVTLSLVLLAFGGIGCDKKTPSINNPPPSPPNQEQPMANIEILLYFGDDQAMYLIPEKRLVEVEEDADDEMIATVIINQLIKGPESQDLMATIPPEAKLLSVKIKNHIAYLDFSEELRTKHGGGSAGETMTITSLANSLTELNSINKIQLLIEGEILESLSGHWDTSEPIDRNLDIIKK